MQLKTFSSSDLDAIIVKNCNLVTTHCHLCIIFFIYWICSGSHFLVLYHPASSVLVGIYCQLHFISVLLFIRPCNPFLFQGDSVMCNSKSCRWFFGDVSFLLFHYLYYVNLDLISWYNIILRCRVENDTSAGIVDKIKIFRPDRVFKVICEFMNLSCTI